MDFRKCPACEASVLDDDVEDCPFCGASMSGKPKPAGAGSKATAAPKESGGKSGQAKKPAVGGTSPKPGGAVKAQAKASDADKASEDDPFDVDTTAVRKALKLAPRPTQKRTYEIVCPMCETKGYMLPQDAGKDVQCSNPDCIVPVFKSKRPKVEAPVLEEGGSKKGLIIGGSLVAALVIGGGVFMMMGSDNQNGENVGSAVIPIPAGPQECDDCPVVPECDDCEPEKISLAEIRQQSMNKVVVAARERGSHNRNVGTQLAAEALAVAGNLKGAQEELKRLQNAGQIYGYLQLQPLAEVAWAQLKIGDVSGATKSAETAISKAKNLPPTVRQSLDSVTSVAAVLVAVGKQVEALKLVNDQIADAENGLGDRLHASVLWRAAVDSGSYDFELEARRPYHSHIPDPDALRMGVVETLVAHGYAEPAWKFIGSDSSESVSSIHACQAAWAGRVTQQAPNAAINQVSAKVSSGSLSPIAVTRIWSAVASHLATSNHLESAKTAFESASAAAAKIPAPKPEAVLSMKDVFETQGKPFSGLTNPAEERSAAMACMDVAISALQIGQADQTIPFVEKSMEYARATSLPISTSKELVDACENREAQVKRELQSALRIDDSRVRNAFSRYRRLCGNLNDDAQKRLSFQVSLLRAIAEAGLREPLWDYLVAQNSNTDIAQRDPFVETEIAGLLFVLADLEGKTDLANSITNATNIKENFHAVDRGIGPIRRDVKQGKLNQAGQNLRGFYRSQAVNDFRDFADIATLSLISKVFKRGTIPETYELLTTVADPAIREDAFLLFAAHTVQAGKATDLWEHMQTPAIRELSPLEKESIYKGFLLEPPSTKIASPTIPEGAE